MQRMLIAAVLGLAMSTTAAAGPQSYVCRGKVTGPEGSIRGQVTVSKNSLSVSRGFLWIKDDVSYSIRELESARLRRGLLFTRARLNTGPNGGRVVLRAWAWHYDPLREVIKESH